MTQTKINTYLITFVAETKNDIGYITCEVSAESALAAQRILKNENPGKRIVIVSTERVN